MIDTNQLDDRYQSSRILYLPAFLGTKSLPLMKYFTTDIVKLFYFFLILFNCYLEWNSNKLWVKMSEYG